MVVEMMSDENSSLLGQWSIQNQIVKKVVAYMSIDSGQGIVKKNNFGRLVVSGTSKTQALSLTTR
jgi:hypothetical protein